MDNDSLTSQKRSGQQRMLIEGLARDYATLWCFNSDDKVLRLAGNGLNSPTMEAVVAAMADRSYTEALSYFVKSYVSEEDRDKVLSALSWDTLLHNTEEGRVYHTSFASENLEGDRHYFESSLLRAVDEEGVSQFVLGFRSIDDLIRGEKEKQAQLESCNRQLEENNRLQELIGALIAEYSSVFSVDLVTEEFSVYKQSDRVLEKYGDSFCGASYSEVVSTYLRTGVSKDDRALMESVLTVANLRSRLEDTGSFSMVFRNNEDQYCEMKVARTGADSVIVGFATKDEEIRGELEAERLERELGHTFYNLFESVYLVDIDNGSFRILQRKEWIDSVTGMVQDNYFEDLYNYAQSSVVEEDREELLRALSPANLRAQLVNGCNTLTVAYRDYHDTKSRYMECRVAKADDSAETHSVMFIFLDTDAETRKKMELNAKVAKQHTLISSLSREYVSVWYVNSADRIMKLVESNPEDNTTRMVIKETINLDYDQASASFINNYVVPEDREVMLTKAGSVERLKQLTADGRLHRINFCRVDKAGERHYMAVIIVRSDDERGRPHFTLGFRLNDEAMLAELDKQEQLRHALDMAQAANRAKTTFLNNMSHDIRTPMNAIIGFSGLAASHIDNKRLVQDYLTKIGQSSNHLLSLINDVLDMSRIESGKMNLVEREENLSSILHTLRDIVLTDIQAKQIDFYIDTVDVMDEDIICDKLRLNQVLLNIISNAIKYTPARGTVSLRITEKKTCGSGYASYEFMVKDNGIGMSQEFLKNIFEPFTRVLSSTMSGIQGTGLGMAITKNIVDMMGGTIDIESQEGKGTAVKVEVQFMLQGSGRKPRPIKALEGTKALVIDDDTGCCVSICEMLRSIGMRPDWCTSGKEAVVRTEEAIYHMGEHFKLFIIDWLMPDMNGVETTRRIRRLIGPEASIVILTAYDYSDIEDEALEAGVTAFLNKPLFESDLERTLARLCGEAEEESVPAEPVHSFVGHRLLLVEDNPLNMEIAYEILRESGFEVDKAEDGAQAVDKLAQSEPGTYELVLMDVQMPIMDGYEAARRIRKLGRPDIADIPIVAMTANAFEEDKETALAAGMNAHIAKPIDIPKLMETLSIVLSGIGNYL